MNKLLPKTVGIYLFKKFLITFLIILFCLLAVIFIFDLVELLRRAVDKNVLQFQDLIVLSLLKLPEVGQQVFTFAILFTAIFIFWQLTKKHELVILRSVGLSVWQFIMPVILCAFLIGVVKITVINPLGVLLVERYETLEAEFFSRKSNPISLSNQGLWMRQEVNNQSVILHAKDIKLPSWELEEVTLFFFDPNGNFQKRVDAPRGSIDKNLWILKQAVENQVSLPPNQQETYLFETNMTRQQLEENFSSPETVSFWDFPENIKRLEATGLNANQMKVYFQNLLSQPLLFMAMILLAATVSLRPPRAQGGFLLLILGIGIGFLVFFSSNFLQALGISGQIPLFIAAWFPAIISFVLGIGLLMNLEDG
ncbi:MAG: LPS export ABC transporter permease LptG [Pseudomonadota bacterium]